MSTENGESKSSFGIGSGLSVREHMKLTEAREKLAGSGLEFIFKLTSEFIL